MRRIKNRIARLSIRRKLIFYSYVIITPILLLISILLLAHNYLSAVKNEENRCIQNVRNISDSISVVQNNIMEMGTYISINEEIKQILTADDPKELNRDARLWLNRAPMQIIQDMVAIDGHIKSV
ncbi:MAG: sensor histidine kinase, partial [Lachnospiraceae bacterium]|nr:sensor histidine kinase [Lachnospiraceae bacterium]